MCLLIALLRRNANGQTVTFADSFHLI